MQPLYEKKIALPPLSIQGHINTRAASRILLTTFLGVSLGLSACSQKDSPAAATAVQQAPPEVSVLEVRLGSIALVSDLPGRLEAFRTAQVRARAAGIVQKRLFTEGAEVKAGQQLFQIDNTPYRAALQSAQASLAQAEAALAQASATARRYKPLVEANAISKQDFEAAITAEKAAQAQVAAAKAGITNANVNLGYATVTAPIAGRIGRSLVTEGALVGQGDATPLATIQQINPLYVNITQSSGEILRLREALAQGKLSSAADTAQVRVFTEDGKAYPHLGRLLFTDLSVDPTTGQVSVRAELPNPQGLLLPGMYIRVQIEQANVANAVLIPQQAVTRNEKGNFVMTVAADGSVVPRPVDINGSKSSNWVVTGGLQDGDKVMIDGLIKVGMGATKVTPVPWKGDSKPASPATPQTPEASAETKPSPAQ